MILFSVSFKSFFVASPWCDLNHSNSVHFCSLLTLISCVNREIASISFRYIHSLSRFGRGIYLWFCWYSLRLLRTIRLHLLAVRTERATEKTEHVSCRAYASADDNHNPLYLR